jgi:hypothetical protein
MVRRTPSKTDKATSPAQPKAPPLSERALAQVVGGYIGETEKNIGHNK